METKIETKNKGDTFNINGPRGYYGKRNNSDRERHIPYDFPYIWNQRTKEGNKNNVTKADTKKRENWYSHKGGRLGGGMYKICKVDEEV